MFVTDVWDDIRELTSGYFSGDEPLRDNKKNRFHKQQTSIQILLRIILSSSNPRNIVFDPFAGTGTTLVASTQLNRYSIGIEKSPKNVKKIKSRISKIRKADQVDRHYRYYQYTKNLNKIWGTPKPKGTMEDHLP